MAVNLRADFRPRAAQLRKNSEQDHEQDAQDADGHDEFDEGEAVGAPVFGEG